MKSTLAPLLLLALVSGGCVTLELNCETADLFTTEQLMLVADQPGNVTTSSDLVSTRWTSSDESVLVIEQDPADPRRATATAVGAGLAEISVDEGGSPDVCSVTVNAAAPVTVTVTEDAFQLIEPDLGGFPLGELGYSQVLDTEARYIDTGSSWTEVIPAGTHQLTFHDGLSFAGGGARYELLEDVVVEDGVPLTVTFTGEVGTYQQQIGGQ